jgi:hypothetical protein
MQCQVDTDCASGACDGASFICVSNQCADHRTDGAETDVDCGGGTCAACALGLHCAGDGDCSSSACDGNLSTCVSSQCSDHRQDGSETDVDCGGPTCPSCAVGEKCLVSQDCPAGHVCNSSKVCQ